ncbi:MAG: caspase family protein, partial [Anaerolineales bacterium]|nr:caspase family protein [Anaerolineales bacterium]
MAQRLALIIGSSVFRDKTLARLIKPDADVGALADVLLDKEIGDFNDVKLLVNMSSTQVRGAISDFYSKKHRDDLLLLYFSGHGVLDDQGRLYLAVKDS